MQVVADGATAGPMVLSLGSPRFSSAAWTILSSPTALDFQMSLSHNASQGLPPVIVPLLPFDTWSIGSPDSLSSFFSRLVHSIYGTFSHSSLAFKDF